MFSIIGGVLSGDNHAHESSFRVHTGDYASLVDDGCHWECVVARNQSHVVDCRIADYACDFCREDESNVTHSNGH